MTSPWVDVGPLLAAGCTEMGVNDMLHIPHFSLFEAMSAVEIGNVKMDSGATRGMSIDAHLDSGQAPVDLTPEQACAIMDHLMLLEATHYFSGNAAAASVYSSLYMMRPDRLTTACPSLAAYCKGVEATCLAVRWFLMNGAVSEEEDISLLISGLPLEEAPGGIAHLPSEDCLPQLLAAQKAAAQAAADCATAPEQAGVWDRIGQHLTFRHALIKALLQLKQKNGPALHTAQKALTQAAAQLAKLHASPPRTAAPIAAVGPGPAQSDVLAAKVCSNGSGSAAEQPGCEGAGVGSSVQQRGLGVVGAEGPACLGYVPGLNHHLLYPAPPRATQMMSEADSRQQWATLLTHLQAAAALDDILGWRALQLHVLKLAGLRMGVVARCIAHYLVAGKAWSASNAGQHAAGPGSSSSSNNSGPSAGSNMGPGNDEWPSWVLDTPMICEALALPVVKSLGPDVDMFLEQAVIAAGNWVQAMLLNPCRQRRRLRRGLEDWAHLYQHALNADLSPEFQAWMSAAGWRWVPGQAGPPDTVSGAPDPQGVLATWVESETALSQYSHLLLGFKLDLYSVQEYCLIFWYSASLLDTRKHALQLLHSVQAPVPGKGPQLPSGGKAKKSTKPLPPSPATVRRQAGLLADAVLCEQYASLAVGLVRLLAGLQAAGLTKAPKLPFNTLREQFDQRFASFHSPSLVKPVPLSFAIHAACYCRLMIKRHFEALFIVHKELAVLIISCIGGAYAPDHKLGH
ncbi:Mak10 subunit, NatC N-terminal acetyltransferase-domain-containing protein [Haematococcus lacustris]